jgi:hypothetical protein
LWVRESAHGKYRINGPGIEGGEVFLTAFAGLIANAGDIVDVGIEAIRQRLKLHRNEAATPVLSAQEWSANSILGLRAYRTQRPTKPCANRFAADTQR